MLTDSQCRSPKCKDKPYKLTDASGLYLEVKPNGVKAWRYRFKLTKAGVTKENLFAIGESASAPPGETAEQAKARRAGGRFTLAEARDERTKARALVKQGINPAHHRQFGRIKREQENATKHDPWPCINYVPFILKSAYREFVERVGETSEPRGSKTQMVLEAIAKMPGTSSLADLERACPGVSRDMIRRVLNTQKGQSVDCIGRGPGAL